MGKGGKEKREIGEGKREVKGKGIRTWEWKGIGGLGGKTEEGGKGRRRWISLP